MAVPEPLSEFVQASLARGLPRADIEAALLKAGWEKEQVKAGLGSFAEVEFPVPVPRPVPYLSAREAFLYLLLFSTLYLCAWNLGNVGFQLVNIHVPDPADTSYYGSARDSIRWSLAAIIVSFPVFFWMSSLTNRELHADPTKRASRVRRWLTYLTLFLAAVIIISVLIDHVDKLLSGELSRRILVKGLIAVGIAGTLFVYYLKDLRADGVDAPR
ncbi:MAG TPA: DUF5671 domain-containing protein [Gemmatimonadales bacterium]|nr:DUF5671 domain-containing protein [Gemmatimonadales bacterium]